MVIAVSEGVKLLLYAPTYRETTDTIPEHARMDLNRTLRLLEEGGDKWMCLYRAHYLAGGVGLDAVKDRLIDRLEAMEGVTVNSQRGALSAPHVVSASFAGVRAEVLLHALEDKGIYVSSGSACSSNHPAISGTLQAIGVPKELLDSTLRFSFGIYNEPEEADYTADCIEELLPELRKFRRY